MNKSELDLILKKARIPQPPEEFWEDFPEQVTRQLDRPSRPERLTRKNLFPRFAWAVAMAVCIAMAFVAGHWRGRTEATAQPQDVLANAKLVQQTLAMFPNQVRAIVEDKTGLHLVLSDGGSVASSSPIYVHLCDGKNCSSLVTFSGQEIQIAGQKMTVLANTRGGIILMGDNFVWASDEETASIRGLKIEAKNLGSEAL
ncbi:MAG TPA: hypothetical protein VGJ73_19695 [Verrucomicrobiae bacterium]|jgi:hypothetical protein